jgi:hypothetical protein
VIRKDFSLGIIAAPGLTTDFLLNDLTLSGPCNFNQGPRFDFVALCCTSLIPQDTILGDQTRGTSIEHVFISTGDPPLTWSNLTLTSSRTPWIAPTLSQNGQFSWNSTGSLLGSYSWNATVTNLTGSAVASLTVRLVPEASTSIFICCGLAVSVVSRYRNMRLRRIAL